MQPTGRAAPPMVPTTATGMMGKWFCLFGKEMEGKLWVKFVWEGKGEEIRFIFILLSKVSMGRKLKEN